jgi:hypothetical protein
MGDVMIVNDEDSLEFWCPMVRVFNPVDKASPYNAVAEFTDGKLDGNIDRSVGGCSGSECMMWRYANSDPDDSGGYCGLAGVPKV